jgi:hypothetical protein
MKRDFRTSRLPSGSSMPTPAPVYFVIYAPPETKDDPQGGVPRGEVQRRERVVYAGAYEDARAAIDKAKDRLPGDGELWLCSSAPRAGVEYYGKTRFETENET